jgi:uncharacterized protein YegP (UPF0339 family)/Flp pilus assembly protein TadD
MAFCEQCGNKISDTAKFCGKCGAPIVSGQPEAQAEIPQASAPATGESPARKAYNAGIACKEAGRFDEAIAHFTEAIGHRPDIWEPYFERGHAYGRKEEYDSAITDFTSVLRLASENHAAYYMRGLIYYTKEQYDSAITDFSQAIRLTPNEAGYYHARGKAYACLGDFDTGIADFTKAIQIAPDVAEAYGCRSAAYLEKGDPEKARADLERGLQIDPDDETLVELAEVFNEAMSAPGTCTQCGASLDEDEVFCSNCGAKVGGEVQYQPAPVQMQEAMSAETILRGYKPKKFEIYEDKQGEFRFRLKAVNGETLATGEGYPSTGACKKVIAAIKKNAPTAEFGIYKNKKGEFRFRLKAVHGETLATGESYPDKEVCRKVIAAIKKNAPTVEIEDTTMKKPAVKKPLAKKPLAKRK